MLPETQKKLEELACNLRADTDYLDAEDLRHAMTAYANAIDYIIRKDIALEDKIRQDIEP